MRRALPAVLLVAVASCARPTTAPAEILAAASSATIAAGTARLSLAVDAEAPGPRAVTTDGVVDFAARRSHLVVRGATAGPAQVVIVPGRVHVRVELPGRPHRWLELPARTHVPEPTGVLAVVARVAEPRRVGAEHVRGVRTDRYRGRMGARSVDVWVDGRHLVRRVAIVGDGARVTLELFDFGVTVSVDEPAGRSDELMPGPAGSPPAPPSPR